MRYENVKIRKADGFDLLLFGFALVASSFQQLNIVGLYIAVPVLIFRCFRRGSNAILASREVKYYIYLLMWFLFTSITGEDIGNSIAHLPVILASALISFCVYYLAKNPQNMRPLCYIWVAFYAGLMLYLYMNGRMAITTYEGSERAGGVEMNANNFCYYLPYLTLATYYLFINKRKKGLLTLLWVVLISAFSLYISLLTASRQTLVMQVPLLLMLLFAKYHSSLKKNFSVIILIVITAIAAAPTVTAIYDDSLLAKRSEVAMEDDLRTIALKNAIKVGNENIVFGVGTGNYIHHDKMGIFSHNSYAELYSTTGLMGLLLYILIFVPFLIKQLKVCIQSKDPDDFFIVTAIAIFLLQNMFYVYYVVPWLMAFPFMIMGYSKSKKTNCLI